MRKSQLFHLIKDISTQIPFFVVATLIFIVVVFGSLSPIEYSLPNHNSLLTNNIVAHATDESNSIVFEALSECAKVDSGEASLVACLRQAVSYFFFLGIGLFFVRVAWIIILSNTNAGNGGAAKNVKLSVADLVIGLIFIGMPTVIMGLINPGGVFLGLGNINEFNLKADLISALPNVEGCAGFEECRKDCMANKTDDALRLTCISTCKVKHMLDCPDCQKYVNEKGTINEADKTVYNECISPSLSDKALNSMNCTAFKECLLSYTNEQYSCPEGNGSCYRGIARCLETYSDCSCADATKFNDNSGSFGNGGKSYSGPTDPTTLVSCVDKAIADKGNTNSSSNTNVSIDRNNWLATAPNLACIQANYGKTDAEAATHFVDYDFSFLGGGTAKINKDAVAGFDCVKGKLQTYKKSSGNADYTFPGTEGSPNFGGDYTFKFGNTTGRAMNQKSFHPYGLAIDLNVGCNSGAYCQYLNCRTSGGGGQLKRDMPEAAVVIFNSCGFFWGGDWPGRQCKKSAQDIENLWDPMHFEYHAITCPDDTRTGVKP